MIASWRKTIIGDLLFTFYNRWFVIAVILLFIIKFLMYSEKRSIGASKFQSYFTCWWIYPPFPTYLTFCLARWIMFQTSCCDLTSSNEWFRLIKGWISTTGWTVEYFRDIHLTGSFRTWYGSYRYLSSIKFRRIKPWLVKDLFYLFISPYL